MSDGVELTLTLEEKLRRAQGSLNAYVLAMILYLKENGLSEEAFWEFVGRRHAQGWDPETTAIQFISEEAAFLVSIGCELRSLSGEDVQASAVVTSWPPDGDWTAAGFPGFLRARTGGRRRFLARLRSDGGTFGDGLRVATEGRRSNPSIHETVWR